MASGHCPLAAVILCAVVVAAAPNSPPSVVTSAAYLSAESDIIDTAGWMRTLYGVQMDLNETKCAAEDKVLYRPLRQCFFLYRRGPCSQYEWLVFDKEKAASGHLTAVCRRRMCAPNWGYDAAKNTCFEQSKCKFPTAFHYTLFGDGVCRCNGTKGRLATAPSNDDSACYELYHHQPCKKGWMMAPRYRLVEGMDAMCFRDPCIDYKPPAGNVSVPAAAVAASKRDVTTQTPTVRSSPREGRTTAASPERRQPAHSPSRVAPALSGASPSSWGGSPQGSWPNAWGGFQPVASGNYYSRGREVNGAGQFDGRGPGIVDVEVITVPSRPGLGIHAATHGVIVSGNGASPQNVPVHDHWNGHHGHVNDHEYHVGGLPGFKISLKPLHLVLVPGGRVRRDVIFPDRASRNARGDPDSRVGSEYAREGRGPAGGKGGAPARNPDAKNDSPTGTNTGASTSSAGATNDADEFTLEVQYSNGDRSCMTSKQLNVICDLMMWPLFSDLSELKVPLCVNTLFRFALGRVGKSDECAENDAGKCAQKVVVKSPDPLDWELE